MSLVSLLIALIVIGAILYIVGMLPIDATIKRVIQVIAIVLLAIWAIKTLLPMAGVA